MGLMLPQDVLPDLEFLPGLPAQGEQSHRRQEQVANLLPLQGGAPMPPYWVELAKSLLDYKVLE